jgi:hypothetical protein
MSPFRSVSALGVFALLTALGSWNASAHWSENRTQIKHVFVIALENHNWTQPPIPGEFQPIYRNPNAPFINSLVNGTALAFIDGRVVNISEQVAYATAYHNVLATPSGENPHIHPSEPNYIWAEAGTNFGILNDDDPFVGNPPNSQNTTQHLTGLLQKAGKMWRSYQEDIDLTTDSSSQLINLPLPQNLWTVPLVSRSGLFGPGNYLNAYNNSIQYDYACKHNPQVFFADTSGGNNTTPSNPLSRNYAPLQQLAFDLASDNVAD